jgi:replication-associated recombination protein RarA
MLARRMRTTADAFVALLAAMRRDSRCTHALYWRSRLVHAGAERRVQVRGLLRTDDWGHVSRVL